MKRARMVDWDYLVEAFHATHVRFFLAMLAWLMVVSLYGC